MILKYKDNENRILLAEIDSLIAMSNTINITVVYEDGIGRTAKKKIITENDGKRYFIWNGQNIYLSDYETYDLETICTSKTFDKDLLLASLMKYKNDLGFLMEGVCLVAVSDILPEEFKNKTMLYVLDDRNFYETRNHLTFIPSNKEHWKWFPHTFVTNDVLLNRIADNTITIVEKNKFVKNYNEVHAAFDKMSKFKKKRYLKKNAEPESVLL